MSYRRYITHVWHANTWIVFAAMLRRLSVAVLCVVQSTNALLPPAVQKFALRTPLRCASSKGDDKFESHTQRRGDDDPYAFLADADLAASYSEKDSWAEGAATLLVGVDLPGAALDFDASVSELSELAKGAGLSIVGPPLRRRLRQPDPQTYTDSAGVDRIREAIADLVEEGAEEVAVVFDDELTPDQQKNLEKRLQVATRDELQPRNKKIDKKKKALEKQARVFELRQESPYLSQAAARAKINQEDRKLRRRGSLLLWLSECWIGPLSCWTSSQASYSRSGRFK